MSKALEKYLPPEESKPLEKAKELLDIANKDDFLSNVTNYFGEVCNYFEEAIKQTKDLQNDDSDDGIAQQYVAMSKIFWRKGESPQAAVDLLLHGSEQFAQWQSINEQYVSRSTLFSQLTAYYFHVYRDIGAATWWALHLVTDGGQDHSGVDSVFVSRLGYPEEVAKKLREKRQEFDGEIHTDKRRESFTEDIIRDFFVKNPQYHYILGNNSNCSSFPICRNYYDLFICDIDKKDKKINSLNGTKKKPDEKEREKQKLYNEKGELLEQLACYLFLLIPGCAPRYDVKDQDNVHQTDLVVLNRHPIANLTMELFGRHIAVECKNWKKSVGVPEVGYFLHKIHLMHTSFGVIFALNGISGDRSTEEIRARQLIRRTYHEDHTLCVVVTENDLNRLSTENISFRDLLIQLADEFRFGK